MGHHCCNKQKVKRGLWSPEEDEKLMKYITTHGHGSWSSVPKSAGLQRCGKSCRLRWINYLRPDLKRGSFSAQEERIIIDVHRILGNRWAQIAKHLPGRTDNEVKNFWNSCIKKKLIAQGLDPKTHNLIPTSRPPNGTNNLTTLSPLDSPQSSTIPFTITPPMKSFDTMKNSMDLNAHLMTLSDMPMSNFPYQDFHLMSFTNQESHASLDFANACSSTSIGHTNISSSSFHQPGYVDDGGLWACALDAMQVMPKQLNEVQQEKEEAQEQSPMCKMDFNEVNEKGVVDMETSYGSTTFDLELESALLPCGVFCNGSTMEQLQWDC